MRTPIIGRPRPRCGRRHADPRYTLNCEEPIYRVQQQHRPGQTVGLGALLPILAETHDIPDERIRTYSAALVHPAGLNLRNQLMHGFGGLTGPDTAAIILHLLLHLGTLTGLSGPSRPADSPADEESSHDQ